MTAAGWLPSRKRVVVLSSVLLLVIAAALAWQVWRTAELAVQDGAKMVASAGLLRATLAPLHTIPSAFEPVLPAMSFRSAAVFQGDLFVADEGSLLRWSSGECRQTWHTGRELPPAPLVSIAVRTGVGDPELWIATGGAGLLIYDGRAFRQLLPTIADGRKISALLPLQNGEMLAGTPNAGLYVTDGNNLRMFHQTLNGVHVTALAGDEDDFWVGTRSDGAWHWRGGEATHITSQLPDQQVLSLATSGHTTAGNTAHESTAWVGTALGIAEFVDGKFHRYLGEGLFAQALGKDNDALWVATVDQGTVRLPLSVASPHPQRTGLISAELAATASFIDMNEGIAAVQPRQIVQLPDRRVLISASEGRLNGRHITAVHADGQNKLWVGYFDNGLDIVRRSGNVPRVDHVDDDRVFCVHRIRENGQTGEIAVAAANGLALFDRGGQLRRVLDRASGLIASHVTDVLFTGGTTVVATPAGLSFLDTGISSLYGFHGLVNNHVYTLAHWDDRLYAGTLGGVSTIKGGQVDASFTTANSELRQNWITASQTFDGKLYLGTYGGGVIGFKPTGAVARSESFAHKRVEINPNALAATGKALYAGTAGYGLAVLLKGEERWRFVTDGLPSLNVTALDARNGELYVGTDCGLLQVSEANLLP